MKKKFSTVALLVGWIAALSCVLFLVFVFRPYAKPDTSLVDPSLAGLREPFKEVLTYFYKDGGSIGIHIVDQTGTKLELFLPARAGIEDNQYLRVFVGAREVTNPHHTKLRLLEILRSHPGFDQERDASLAFISGRWSDYWRVIRRIYLFRSYKR